MNNEKTKDNNGLLAKKLISLEETYYEIYKVSTSYTTKPLLRILNKSATDIKMSILLGKPQIKIGEYTPLEDDIIIDNEDGSKTVMKFDDLLEHEIIIKPSAVYVEDTVLYDEEETLFIKGDKTGLVVRLTGVAQIVRGR
jgi:hypothetical protein